MRHNRSFSTSFSASVTTSILGVAQSKQRSYDGQRSEAHAEASHHSSEASQDAMEKKKRMFHIVVILVVILCFGMLFSIFAPFYPAEAAKKGMSPFLVGLLFGVFELVVFLLSPVWGVLAPRIGFRFLIASGMFMAGGATILFGFLDRCPEGPIYIFMCFACRLVEATGVSMYITAAFAYGSSLYPDDVAFIYGLLETFNGAGFMVGPPLGGLLYNIGGFTLPFVVIGGLILVLGSISTFLLKSQAEEESSASVSPLLLLKMPLIIVLGISESVCSMVFAFLDPTLSIFLESIGITDPLVVGAMFMICSISYTVACLFTGKAVEKLNAPFGFMIFGAALTCVGYLLLGPSPLIPLFAPSEASIIVACLIGFAGLGFLMIPIPKLLTETMVEYGFDGEATETNSLVSGVYNCVWYFGSFIGPTAAGGMVDAWGFLWSSTIMAFMAAAVCVLLIITSFVIKSEAWKAKGQYRYAVFMIDSVDEDKEADKDVDDVDDDKSSSSSENSGLKLNESDDELDTSERLDDVAELNQRPERNRRSRVKNYGAIGNSELTTSV